MRGQGQWIKGYVGAWTFLALYFTTWDAVMYPSASFGHHLLINGLQNLVWAILGLGLVWLAERRPLESFSLRHLPTWGMHLLASLLAAALGLFVAFMISRASTSMPVPLGSPSFWRSLKHFYSFYLHTNLLILWGVVGAYHGWRLQRRLRERELEAVRLEARFAEAQHQALRMQLQPHFLFNTLNSISALVHSDPEAADRMISRLGDFLRMTLDEAPDAEVPLRKELAFIEAYLAIERIRFRERLKVEIEVPPALMSRQLPAFLLQPLVENALKHGLEGRPQGGTLRLRAHAEGEDLVIELQDDGLGFRSGREGVGLSNVRARLGLRYKGRATLELLGQPGAGTLVVLRLPGEEDEC